MDTVLIESHYLPSLEYFCAIDPFENIILENTEHFVKQSFRNRCWVNAAHGPEMLVVPLTGKHGKIPFRDIQVDFGTKWKNNHWRTICSAYARAPFFEHYSDDLNEIFFRNTRFLCDLNERLLSLCLGSLGVQKKISATVTYEKDPKDVFDLRSAIRAKESYELRPFYQPASYHQVFGNAFAGNLSLLDLLFCEGPDAVSILKASRKKILNK
jgi:hypothetical protein